MTETYLSPIWISLKTVLTATAISFILGVAAARWMVNYRGRLKNMIDGVFILPMVLPPTVVGLVLLLIFGRNGPLGQLLLQFGTTIVFSWPATVITAVVVAFPLMYLTVRGSFEQIDPHIEDAARTLGASEWKVFRSVTLPLAKPGVFSGAVLSFARALGEFGATLMLAGNLPGKTQTIPVAIYFAVESGQTSTAWVMVLVVLCLSLAAIATLAYWKGRNGGIRFVNTKTR